MKQEEKQKHYEEVDAQHPEVKVFVNLFYEFASINEYLLPHAEEGLKYYNKAYKFDDKKRYSRICSLMAEIRRVNDEMKQPLWDQLPTATHTLMRKDANDMARILLLIVDRVGCDPTKFAMLEEWLRMMPSGGFVSDEIIDRFILR